MRAEIIVELPLIRHNVQRLREHTGVAMMTVVDAALTFQRHRPDLDPVRFALARRLDDAAYGLGVWTGAWRARTLRPLIPRWHMTGRSR